MSRTPPVGLVPVLLDKPWGGDQLARWGLPVAPGAHIGEAWMFADIGRTAVGGAGGGAFHSKILGSPIKNYDLRDAAREWEGGLTGAGSDVEHPLLVKLLHAAQHLSVQVHPSPAYAAAHPEARLKGESWYVLHAEPGAELFLGLAPGCTADEAMHRAREGRIADVLQRVPAVPGDCHTLPSGMVHALGAGVVVAEVQTASDTTFRLYDWPAEYGRAPRALHLDEAREAMLPDARPTTVRAVLPPAHATAHDQVLAATSQYVVRQRWLERGHEADVAPGAIVLAVSGFGRLDDLPVTLAYAVFARDGGVMRTPHDRTLTWLETTLSG